MIPLQESYSSQTLSRLQFPRLTSKCIAKGETKMKLLTILMLSAIAVGCGYGSQSTTPPTAGTTPTINALVPDNVDHGAAAFTLMVNGANFGSRAVINFNGAAMTTSWMNAGQVTAQIPASAIMNAGVVPVTVTNPAVSGGQYGGGTSAATSVAMNFTIN
jgi:IPT/TIG domain